MSWQQQKESSLAFQANFAYNYNPDCTLPKRLPDDKAAQTRAWAPVQGNLPTNDQELYYPHQGRMWYQAGEMPEVRIYQAPLQVQLPRRGVNRVGYATAMQQAQYCKPEYLPGQEVLSAATKSLDIPTRPPAGYPLGRRVVEPPSDDVQFGATSRPQFLIH